MSGHNIDGGVVAGAAGGDGVALLEEATENSVLLLAEPVLLLLLKLFLRIRQGDAIPGKDNADDDDPLDINDG